MVMTRSTCSAISFGVAARFAPSSTSSAAADSLWLLTTSSCPAASRFLAMGLPMIPRPMNPIFMSCSFLDGSR
jgi:hypothetical protein